MADTLDDQPRLHPAAIVGGVILLCVAAALFAQRNTAFDWEGGHELAPLVLIVLGALSLANPTTMRRTRSRRLGIDSPSIRVRRHGWSGLWLLGTGVWLLIARNHLFGLTPHTAWPLFIVLAGVMLVFRGVTR